MPQPLIEDARRARDNAYAPYSGYKVGAAIRAASGQVYTGCNVENAAFPQSMCAEAAALAAMVSAGETEILQVAVIADGSVPLTPCGGCRQKLAEFATAEIEVTMANLEGLVTTQTLGALLPDAFAAQHMDRR